MLRRVFLHLLCRLYEERAARALKRAADEVASHAFFRHRMAEFGQRLSE